MHTIRGLAPHHTLEDIGLHPDELVVVTCASGKQATPIINRLAAQTRAPRLRLVVNSEASQKRLQHRLPRAEVVTADLAAPADCARVVAGATAVLHIGPPFHPQERQMGLNMVAAAAAASTVRHFVFSSVLHSQLRKLLNHDCKRPVEEALFESGLQWTVLQPTHLLDMIPLERLAAHGDMVFEASWNPDTPFSFVALDDLAEATTTVLNEREAHFFASYELCSTGALSYRNVVGAISRVVGKAIRIEQTPYEQVAKMFPISVAGGEGKVTDYHRDCAERLILYYNRYGLVGNPNVLRWLIGRKPTEIETWVKVKWDSIHARQSESGATE